MNLSYEDRKTVNEYLLFHYGSPNEILPYELGPSAALDFAVRAVTETFDFGGLPSDACALDLGCAVGRSTFELSRYVQEVIGIDFSQAFIEAAKTVQREGAMTYERIDEGKITTSLVAGLPEGAQVDRIRFERGDAMSLRDDLGSFDAVLLANLICRLAEPERCLARLPALVKPGGQLVITSPYTWMEEYTALDQWLGGQSNGGEPVFTTAALEERLSKEFALEAKMDLPFLIREHARKFQWSVAQATRWRRKNG